MKVSSGTNAPWRDEELLRKKYVDEEMTMVEVAGEFDCHHTTIRNWIERHGIEKRDTMGRYEDEKPWTDEDWMYEKYVEEELSQIQIANIVEANRTTIARWIKRHGIESRSLSEASRLRNLNRDVPLNCVDGYRVWRHKWQSDRDNILVHRLLAVAEYGFEEVSGKVVHHKNGVRWDNRSENIELLTRSEHIKHHMDSGDIPVGE